MSNGRNWERPLVPPKSEPPPGTCAIVKGDFKPSGIPRFQQVEGLWYAYFDDPSEINGIKVPPSNTGYEVMNHQTGVKDTKGKVRVDLVPKEALHAIARVREFGSTKYGNEWEWLKGGESKDFLAAAIRHLFECLSSIDDDGNYVPGCLDHESNLPHLHHALTSISMAVTLEEKKK